MIDLYSSPTPNGRKITIMLEELGVEYNPIFIDLDQKKQFSEEFSKISFTSTSFKGFLKSGLSEP